MKLERSSEIPGVVELMKERRERGSKPGRRDDGSRVAVVVEAGAMLGKVGGAQAAALEMLNLWNSVDDVFGVSAGAATVAYVIAGQAAEGSMIYPNHLVGREFINPRRWPVVNIPFLTHEVMKNRVKLDYDRLNASEIVPHVFVTDAKAAEAVEYQRFDSRDQLLDVLHDSCLMPVIAGMPKVRGERAFTDGAAIMGSLPFMEAVRAKASHVLVLRNRPESYRKSQDGLVDLVIRQIIGIQYPELGGAMHLGRFNKNRALQVIEEMMADTDSQVKVTRINPEQVFSSLESTRPRLIEAGKEGVRSILRVFS